MRTLLTVSTALVAMAPSVAAACPSCVGNTQYASSQLMMLAGFAFLPWVVVGGFGWLIVKAARRA